MGCIEGMAGKKVIDSMRARACLCVSQYTHDSHSEGGATPPSEEPITDGAVKVGQRGRLADGQPSPINPTSHSPWDWGHAAKNPLK